MIVIVDGRRFIVKLDALGIKTIYEEKVYAKGRPFECKYRPTYWSRNSHKPPTGQRRGSILKRIFDAVQEPRLTKPNQPV